jgi:hypothetical protein
MAYASDEDRTLNQLERTAERNRAELVSTVEELRDRVSPAQVKQDVKQYASRTTQDVFDNLIDKVQENPLQAAAIAVLIGYPVFSLIRSIPVPVMMLGGGAILAGRLTGGDGRSGARGTWRRNGIPERDSSYEFAGTAGGAGPARYGVSGYDNEGRGGRAYSDGGPSRFYSAKTLQSVLERDPMLVTGLGLLAGMLLGGSLAASGVFPQTRHDR